jgi:hypothetical protein
MSVALLWVTSAMSTLISTCRTAQSSSLRANSLVILGLVRTRRVGVGVGDGDLAIEVGSGA